MPWALTLVLLALSFVPDTPAVYLDLQLICIPFGALLGDRYGWRGVKVFAIGGALLPLGIFWWDGISGSFPPRPDVYLLGLAVAWLTATRSFHRAARVAAQPWMLVCALAVLPLSIGLPILELEFLGIEVHVNLTYVLYAYLFLLGYSTFGTTMTLLATSACFFAGVLLNEWGIAIGEGGGPYAQYSFTQPYQLLTAAAFFLVARYLKDANGLGVARRRYTAAQALILAALVVLWLGDRLPLIEMAEDVLGDAFGLTRVRIGGSFAALLLAAMFAGVTLRYSGLALMSIIAAGSALLIFEADGDLVADEVCYAAVFAWLGIRIATARMPHYAAAPREPRSRKVRISQQPLHADTILERLRLPNVVFKYPVAIVASVLCGAAPFALAALLGIVAVDGTPVVWRGFLALVLMPVICLYAAIPVARLLSRTSPLKMTEKGIMRGRWLGVLGAVLAVIGLLTYMLTAALFVLDDLSILRAAARVPGVTAHASGVPRLVDLSFTGLWCAVWMITAWVQVCAGRMLKKSYAVFFRRFSHLPDRVVPGAVIRCLPAETRAVFLSPRRSALGDWDPITIGFAGMRFWRPLSRMPLFLSAPDEHWQETARKLAVSADHVIIDVSEESDALKHELRLIEETAGDGRRVVLICEKGALNRGVLMAQEIRSLQAAVPSASLLPYELSRRLMPLEIAFVVLFATLYAVLVLTTAPTLRNEIEVFVNVSVWIVLGLVATGLFAYSVIRPSLTARSKESLRALFLEGSASSASEV